MTPRLSVIIPTRERSDVLIHTLRTLVSQNYVDCEIVISDNHSKDNTRKIVESFSDSRIRYINTGRRISMSANWEFALNHVRGAYVTCLGDDDGFIPDALARAMSLLETSKADALVWEKIEYCWPDYAIENMKNWISLKNREYSIQVIHGRKKLRQVIRGREAYTKLPCLYNGIIRKALIDRLKSNSINGVLFNSIAPDVFSGIVLSQVVESYLCTDYPFSVNGASRHSTGISFMRQPSGSSHNTPKGQFLNENQCKYDQRILISPSILSIVMGEYMQAKRYLPSLCLPEPSWRKYVLTLIKISNNSSLANEILQSAAHTVKEVGLWIRVPKCCSNIPPTPATPKGFVSERFNLTAPASMVNNIYDACQFVSGMLPDFGDLATFTPFQIFVRRLKANILSSLRDFYRSL